MEIQNTCTAQENSWLASGLSLELTEAFVIRSTDSDPLAKNEREFGGLWRPFQMQLLNQSTASPLLTLPLSMRKTPNKNIPTPSTTKLMFAPHRALIRDL